MQRTNNGGNNSAENQPNVGTPVVKREERCAAAVAATLR
jgi:hypothetical protein